MLCRYCHLPRASLEVAPGTFAHRPCFDRADREDERIERDAGRWQFAPDELAALAELRASPRKPPKRAEVAVALLARRSAA